LNPKNDQALAIAAKKDLEDKLKHKIKRIPLRRNGFIKPSLEPGVPFRTQDQLLLLPQPSTSLNTFESPPPNSASQQLSQKTQPAGLQIESQNFMIEECSESDSRDSQESLGSPGAVSQPRPPGKHPDHLRNKSSMNPKQIKLIRDADKHPAATINSMTTSPDHQVFVRKRTFFGERSVLAKLNPSPPLKKSQPQTDKSSNFTFSQLPGLRPPSPANDFALAWNIPKVAWAVAKAAPSSGNKGRSPKQNAGLKPAAGLVRGLQFGSQFQPLAKKRKVFKSSRDQKTSSSKVFAQETPAKESNLTEQVHESPKVAVARIKDLAFDSLSHSKGLENTSNNQTIPGSKKKPWKTNDQSTNHFIKDIKLLAEKLKHKSLTKILLHPLDDDMLSKNR
jgi:hypothetical protein